VPECWWLSIVVLTRQGRLGVTKLRARRRLQNSAGIDARNIPHNYAPPRRFEQRRPHSHAGWPSGNCSAAACTARNPYTAFELAHAFDRPAAQT
jgi:hypothetical protein